MEFLYYFFFENNFLVQLFCLFSFFLLIVELFSNSFLSYSWLYNYFIKMFLQITIFFSLSSIFFFKIYIYIFFFSKENLIFKRRYFASRYHNRIIQINFSKIMQNLLLSFLFKNILNSRIFFQNISYLIRKCIF